MQKQDKNDAFCPNREKFPAGSDEFPSIDRQKSVAMPLTSQSP
jgi:hypothetical protein